MKKSTKDLRDSPDPDIAGSYNAMIRAGHAAIDLAIQTNTAIVTVINGEVVRIPASDLIKKRLLDSYIPAV
jgi:murein DD-endopeptidase MepM/ murein hydrolase activator NlpD